MDILILVTLGTQDKKFTRLLDAIQKQIDLGNIKDKVIVQAGCSSNYKSKDMEIFDLIFIEKFEKLINKCDVLITHGGVGSIISGLKNNKKVIVAARLKKYGEHTNNHQLQIVDTFSKANYIKRLDKFEDLGKILKDIDKFVPKKYESNASNMVKLVEKEINKYL